MSNKTYKAKVLNVNISLTPAILIYRDAVLYIAEIVLKEWANIFELESMEKRRYIEKLIHCEKNNTAVYDFDFRFPKFPSFLRKQAIFDAIDIASGYIFDMKKYDKELHEALLKGKKLEKKPPQFKTYHLRWPALHEGNIAVPLNKNNLRIKTYKDDRWVWQEIMLREQDLKYLKKTICNEDISLFLIFEGKSCYLQFAAN